MFKRKYYVLIIFMLTLCINITSVKAEDGTVVGVKEYLSLREKKNTSSKELQRLPLGTPFYIVNTEKESGTGCSSGFYYAYYNGDYGYVCAKYVYIEGVTELTYDRPWTTPGKSIIGGAKYIANNYIAKGQNTSYLKKFQVNPLGYYAKYTHQYMANLRAPSSEASNSSKSYKENDLINLPLEFTIPVFNEMPDYTTLKGSRADVAEINEVKDQDFENKLNEQKFPDSYKNKLRALHEIHPNWIFKSLIVNDNFDYAVSEEQAISSIEISSGNCDTPQVVTESGWCIATREAVSYYLDPRNFLTEKYILQFENLGYSEGYTEATVQSILRNTFMAEISPLDENVTYASLFVRAGREANASSVYLASLARQEVGANGSKATSGDQFTYNNVTYKGLYNFYNLGANSSAGSPVLAGLVWASGGSSSVIVRDSVDNPSTPTINESEVLAIIKAKKDGEYVYGYNPNTTVSSITDSVGSNFNVTVTNASGSVITGDSKIGTGSKIKVTSSNVNYEYTVIIYGDLNGDGAINSADLLKMRQHLLGTNNLSGVYALAGNANRDSSGINSADLLKMRQHLLNTSIINQD